MRTSCVHIVKGRRNVSHQCHEEKRHLEDIVLYEVQSFHYCIVPGRPLEVDYKGEEPKQDLDPDNLPVLAEHTF
jgi:hypothetical protein